MNVKEYRALKDSLKKIKLLNMKANVFRYVFEQGIERYEQIKWGSFRTTEELLDRYDLLEKKPEYVAEMNQLASDILCVPGNMGWNYRRVIKEICCRSISFDT